MSLEFYALPHEQMTWIKTVLAFGGSWCVAVRWGRPKSRISAIRTPEDLEGISFDVESPSHLMFYLGLAELSSPDVVESYQGHLQEFTRTLSVRLEASTIVQDRILLEGQLAIGQRWAYEKAGVAPEPIIRWYRRLRRSLATIMSKDWVLISALEDGRLHRWTTAVSPGAVAWRQDGKILTQLPTSPFCYDVARDSKP
jgi:hypothetical protein